MSTLLSDIPEFLTSCVFDSRNYTAGKDFNLPERNGEQNERSISGTKWRQRNGDAEKNLRNDENIARRHFGARDDHPEKYFPASCEQT